MLRRERHCHWDGGVPGGLRAAFWEGRGWGDPGAGCSPGLVAADPPTSCVWVQGAWGRVPWVQRGTWVWSGRATGPFRLLERAPNFPLSTLLCIIPFLPLLLRQAGMLALSRSHPLGMAVPCQAGTLPWVPGRGWGPGQGMGSQAGDVAPGRAVVLEDTPGTDGVYGRGGQCLGTMSSASRSPKAAATHRIPTLMVSYIPKTHGSFPRNHKP